MTSPNDVVIVSATRTPIGSFNGSYANTPAQDLGTAVIKSALDQAKVEANDVNEVIFGHVLTSGLGQNPARQAAINAGMADDSTAIVINQVCGSGLRAVAMGMQQIQSGDADIIVAGGQENMTLSPHCQSLRAGVKMGDYSMTDTMLKDGLIDAFQGYHMGITAENIAEKYQITREAQDEFAVSSQNKAEAALKAGKFKDEITPITVKERRTERVVEDDEFIRMGAEISAMQKLRPAFKKEGTVTAANASGINDGAAALVLMSADAAEKRGLKPLATIKSWATAGVDPAYMGLGPIPASKKALEKAGWAIDDLDLIEANEAFAAQALAVGQELGIDSDKLNVNGGAIALGHPIGASGARVLVTLLHEMKREEKKKGLATLCIGGGMGIALCVERK
ncbi:Acetyl-CoA acetyltransferase [Pseudovibrio sp. W64]|uniref:acetyl-CoA C-acetyltransferase n=1 Tax=unclassified Pseudovibrio TaxID=2627060 RepID=UPI0007AE7B69|nr:MULTISPECIES: acetyl-CoA C-acetyltransferase [unclassified Pseudovibrio]KZK84847.1 Acetyl-CoA acetyltransferase [Pseudovibrio sp. W64]KZK86944.1 Acetyl-CoA acetyltransferase [Pseudovibrio sp. Ad13]KZK93680.1 Acetyl-CoA acetyltransferase [Pseudovibrio sp. W74]KZK96091.1 Acetyl-CoA acetyltransferase [Pseudovibrio sp. Ad46]KZL00855.1 Acetyl-CoA acetyltransferase [Pseudovibrio sp. Ad5]